MVDDLERGAEVGDDPTRQRLARRLVDTEMAHPLVDPSAARSLSVGLVIPSRDDARALVATLHGVLSNDSVAEIVVVDDGSRDATRVHEAVDAAATANAGPDGPSTRIIRRDRSGGPGAARNTGWPVLDTDLIVFVDTDVIPEPGWLPLLICHFGDPLVAAAAPRVCAPDPAPDASLLDRYESVQSPLDLGSVPARVAPDGRIRYVPTATLIVRRDALNAVGGFDESLRYGEDVDLIWRLCEAGYSVRYEPGAQVSHANRESWVQFVRQRFRYGSSAAELDRRHPGAVAPVEVNAWTLGSYALGLAGGPMGVTAGALTAVGSTAALVPRLADRVDTPVLEAARLGGMGHLLAARWLARAGLRSWLPLLVTASLVSRRARRLLAAVVVLAPTADWVERRPHIDPFRWTAARVLDDASYCAGVWYGCLRVRSGRALLPRLVGIEGLRTLWRRSRKSV